MQNKVISADGHIDLKYLPHDLFVSNAPRGWEDQVPRVLELKEGKSWVAEGVDLGTNHNYSLKHPECGESKHIDRMFEAGFYEERPHLTTPELRRKDQEIDGVDAEVIYGILGLGTALKNPELVQVVYQIYNTWVADFRKTDPGRFAALACIPNHDPQVAAGEVRRAAKLGLNGADFVVSSAVKPLWHRDWDPLWAAAEECNIPISLHTTVYPVRWDHDAAMSGDDKLLARGILVTLIQISGAEFLVSMILSGVLDRFPRMKVVLGEAGVGWLPYVLARMDEEYDDRLTSLRLSLKPSEYWRRQGYTTFQHETTVADAIAAVGEDNIMWGSDYPHFDSVWPDSRRSIDQDLGRLEESVRRKLTYENAGRLYGFI